LKRLGESWVRALRLGRIARLWNVYGPEPAAPHWRSHVLADWAASCARSGKVQSLTSGLELRQFVHADDCANALGTMMQRYDQLELVTDIAAATYEQFEREQATAATSAAAAGAADASAASAASTSSAPAVSLNGWVSMRDVGEVFSRLGCPVSYNSDRHAAPRAMLQPRVDDKASFHQRWWKPTIGLQQGIEGLIAYYVQLDAQKAATTVAQQVATNLDASPLAVDKDDDVSSQQQQQQQQAPLPLPELHASAGALHPPAAPLPRRSSVVVSAAGKDEL
jgi:nucleoside-diphosphate-sugar epimerase